MPWCSETAPHSYVPPDDSVERLEIDIVFALIALSISLLLIQLLHWRPSPYLTHGGMSLLVGIGMNAAVCIFSYLFLGTAQAVSVVMSPGVHDIVYLGLLPPIIFEAGFSMRKRGFFHNLVPILLYAIAGTIIATLTAGGLLYALSRHRFLSVPMQLGECFLFAALISPTDPVATLSVLREVNAPPVLKNCIFGEATLNDALSIVLFNVLRVHYMTLSDSDEQLYDTAMDIVRDLLWSAFGSMITGCAFALGVAYFTRRLRLLSIGSRFESTEHIAHAELSLLTMLAMLTFTASERLGFSGIASLFVCGALTRHYTYHNLSPEAQAASMTLFLTLATMCETGLSTLLGVAVFDYLIWFHGGLFGMRFTLATLTIPTLFISRALNIFPLTALVNRLRRGRKGEISIEMQIVMWFSGMRGALSFALAVTLSRGLPQSLAHDVYHQLVAATLFTITVTTLLMAPATRPLIRVLKVGAPTDLQKPFLPTPYIPTSRHAPTPSPPMGQPPSPSSRPERIYVPPSNGSVRDSLEGSTAGDDSESDIAPPSLRQTPPPLEESGAVSPSKLYRMFRRFENEQIKPVFGGRFNPSVPFVETTVSLPTRQEIAAFAPSSAASSSAGPSIGFTVSALQQIGREVAEKVLPERK